jgi:hypothetical protein
LRTKQPLADAAAHRGHAMERKRQLIGQVVERELAMFQSVRARTPVSCQQDPDGFRLMRSAQFSVWSEDTLVAYGNDLDRADAEGRNLMTLKYARMERIIPELHDDLLVKNLIDQIVKIQLAWQAEMNEKYPHLMRRGRPQTDQPESEATSFAAYLRGELETYSSETLASMYRDLSFAESSGRNLSESIYASMVQQLGYDSIEEAERAIATGRA